MDRVALIREHVPDCAITTDIIVGFPGETEADFSETLEVVDEVGYDGAFTFIFSLLPRDGGGGSGRSASAPLVKVERMERHVGLVRDGPASVLSAFVGRTMEVVVEGPSRTDCALACADGPGTTRRSTSTARRDGASWLRWRSRGRPR